MSDFEKLMYGKIIPWNQNPKKLKDCNIKKLHKVDLTKKSKSKFKKGYVFNEQGLVSYDSGWEEVYFKKLSITGVKWLRNSGELKIPYIKPTDMQWHHYIPDFFLLDEKGNISEIKEIKPSSQISDPVVQAKAKAAQKYCESRGWKYGFITEKEIF